MEISEASPQKRFSGGSLLKRLWHRLGANDFSRCLTLALLIVIGGALGITAMVWALSSDLPDLEQLKGYTPRLATRILDRNGEPLTELYTERRMQVPLERIPQHTIDAILTTEDARFWDHWGIDVVRIFGAALVDVGSFSLKQGASTVTQQLARDLYLNRERTFARKIKETLTAIQIERHYSKREILEMYLTQIYFGHGAYGVASAASRYFSKSVDQLTPAESALLAGLPKAPTTYSPLYSPERALARRNLILQLMYEKGRLSNADYQKAVSEPVSVNPAPDLGPLGVAPYFTEMIRQRLSAEAGRLGFDYLADGLTVHTTLDARLQRFAEAALDSQMGEMQHNYRTRWINNNLSLVSKTLYGKESAGTWARIREDTARVDSAFPTRAVLQTALVAMDPRTGDVLAMIGGRDFSQSKFNRAVQAVRQPGSVFKPFCYTAAIDNGYPPCFELLNQDVVLVMYDGTRWAPQNYDGSRGGMTTLREGLRRSLNLVTVRLVQEIVPPATIVKYAHQMGITTPIDAVDAIALGSSGLIPLEAVSAYAVFANQGVWSQPRELVSIDDRFGSQISFYESEHKVALSPQTAYIMTNMLHTAISQGTGAAAYSRWGFDRTAAGKTGTTNDFTDAWFIGFTPNLVCGVWVGLDDPTETIGKGASGAVVALPIWARFMKMACDSLKIPDVDFPVPDGIVHATICADTKQLATPYCPVKIDEIFRADTAPTQQCRKHRRIGL